MSNHYKHITLEGVQYIEEDLFLSHYTEGTGHHDFIEPKRFVWYGPAFDGTKTDEEIEFFEKEIYKGKKPFESAEMVKAARPKEVEHIPHMEKLVEQPVQQESEPLLFKEDQFVFHNSLGTVQVKEIRNKDLSLIVYTSHYDTFIVWQRDCSYLKPSTPMVSETEQREPPDELFAEAERLLERLLPSEQFGEDCDAERLYNIIVELRDLTKQS